MFPITGELETPLGWLSIRRAQPAEAGIVFDLMCDAADWLATIQIKQWVGLNCDGVRKFLDWRVTNLWAYLIEHNEKPIATICLQPSDPNTWGEAGDDGTAGYIHGLAIATSVHGHGLGKLLLTWAEGRFRDAGRRMIRLDCVADNSRLCRYYQELGYREVVRPTAGPHRTRLFEKAIL